MDPEVHHHPISSGVSSTTPIGGLRRSVRDRLGPRPDISRRYMYIDMVVENMRNLIIIMSLHFKYNFSAYFLMLACIIY